MERKFRGLLVLVLSGGLPSSADAAHAGRGTYVTKHVFHLTALCLGQLNKTCQQLVAKVFAYVRVWYERYLFHGERYLFVFLRWQAFVHFVEKATGSQFFCATATAQCVLLFFLCRRSEETSRKVVLRQL